MLKRDKKAKFLEVGIVSLKYQFTSEKKMSKVTLSKSCIVSGSNLDQ
jgi:hypothetical protein